MKYYNPTGFAISIDLREVIEVTLPKTDKIIDIKETTTQSGNISKVNVGLVLFDCRPKNTNKSLH